MDTSKMDKRTKEYKEWAAKEKSQHDGNTASLTVEPDNKKSAVDLIEVKEAPDPLPDSDELERLRAENEQLKSKLSGRKPTKPWDKVDGNHRPFRPNRFLIKPKTEEIGREYRTFFSRPENVETRLAQEYEIAPKSDYNFTGGMIADGSGEAGPIQKGGLILMRKKREAFEQEQAWKEEIRKRQRHRKRVDDVKKEAADMDEQSNFIKYDKE